MGPLRGHDDASAEASETARLARQLATAQQLTHIGSWEWDPSSNEIRWSDELYRIYGLEPQSIRISFDVFASKLHPSDRARVLGHTREVLEKGGKFAYQERILRPSGEVRYLDTVGEAVEDPAGRVVGLIGTCRDVTEERALNHALQLHADVARHVQIGLSVWGADSTAVEPRFLLVTFNPAAERVLGVSLDAFIGCSLEEALPQLSRTELPDVLRQVARDGQPRALPRTPFVKPGAMRSTLSAKAFALPDARVGLTLEDVSEQTRSQELHAAEKRVLERLAAGQPLGDVLGELILSIEQQAPHTIGSILLLDAETSRVHVLAAPHLPLTYNRVVDGERIGPAAGSCGTAAYLKQAVYANDIASDPRWVNYREAALAHGLRACWSTPILSSDGQVLGTFALYYHETRGPLPDELELIARVTHVAGIAMERRQLDDRLRALTGHIEAAREEERAAMAREIHDELGQALTALKMDVAWLGRQLAETSDATARVEARLCGMSDLIDDVIDQVRRIAAQLRPGVLDDLGLAAAIEWQVRELAKRLGVSCHFDSNVHDSRFEPNLSTALFRILQETLTNVARHAQARHVDVSLFAHDARLQLEVRDDGAGMAAHTQRRPSSLGLLGMRERAHRLGGTLSLSSAPGAGTVVRVEVPLRSGEAQ